MQRKTAVAAASAVSMSLAAAAIAIGASFGALGFGAATPSAVDPADAGGRRRHRRPAPTSSPSATGEREHDGRSTGAVTTTGATHEKGHSDD